jgi:hypothetical protein
MIVEPDEVERRSYPRDADDEVKPSPKQTQPVDEVDHGITSRACRAAAQSSPQSRGAARCRLRPHADTAMPAPPWARAALEQLRGDGDCDRGGRLAFDAGDANRANQLLDERGDAIFAKARAKTGGFAFRADQASHAKAPL